MLRVGGLGTNNNNNKNYNILKARFSLIKSFRSIILYIILYYTGYGWMTLFSNFSIILFKIVQSYQDDG